MDEQPPSSSPLDEETFSALARAFDRMDRERQKPKLEWTDPKHWMKPEEGK